MSFGGKTASGGVINIAAETTSLANPITFYKSSTGKYPNNSEVWWSMKRPPDIGADAPPKLYLEVFDPGLRYQVFFGETPAPRGHYILNAFHQDRGAASNVSIATENAGPNRPQATAFFAGRVFWAGTRSVGFNTNIYFSQILDRAEQAGDCFQLYDPTSETLRDLLPTDGGVITVPEVSVVFHMQSFGDSLLIFCDNGVWRVFGSEGVGFRANDYSVVKVSGVPTISAFSFVNVEGVPMWWNKNSINMMTIDDQTRQIGVQSLTDQTIKTYYMDIPEQSKLYAKGAYNPLTKEVQWLFRSETTEDFLEVFNYDRVLVFDTRTQAFVPWTVEHDNVSLNGIFAIGGLAVTETVEEVIHGAAEDNVLANTDNVVVTVEDRVVVESRFKYLVNVNETTETPPAGELI
jgi:hypothetical protein